MGIEIYIQSEPVLVPVAVPLSKARRESRSWMTSMNDI